MKWDNLTFSKGILLLVLLGVQLAVIPFISAKSLNERNALENHESRTGAKKEDSSIKSVKKDLEIEEEGSRSDGIDDGSAFPTITSPDEKLDGSRFMHDTSNLNTGSRDDLREVDGDFRSDDVSDDDATTLKPMAAKSRTSMQDDDDDDDDSRSGESEDYTTTSSPMKSSRSNPDEKSGSRDSIADSLREGESKHTRSGISDDEIDKNKRTVRSGIDEIGGKVRSDESLKSRSDMASKESGLGLESRDSLVEDKRSDVHQDGATRIEDSPFEPRSGIDHEERGHSRDVFDEERSDLSSGERSSELDSEEKESKHSRAEFDDEDEDERPRSGLEHEEMPSSTGKGELRLDLPSSDRASELGVDEKESKHSRADLDDDDDDGRPHAGFGSKHDMAGKERHSDETLAPHHGTRSGADSEKGESKSEGKPETRNSDMSREEGKGKTATVDEKSLSSSRSHIDEGHSQTAELKNDEITKSRASLESVMRGSRNFRRNRQHLKGSKSHPQSVTHKPNVNTTTTTITPNTTTTTMKPKANTALPNQTSSPKTMTMTTTTKAPNHNKTLDTTANYRGLDPEKILAVVVTKDGNLIGKKPNAKVLAKIFQAQVDDTENHALSVKGDHITVSTNNTFIFPAGTYYFPRALRFAGFL